MDYSEKKLDVTAVSSQLFIILTKLVSQSESFLIEVKSFAMTETRKKSLGNECHSHEWKFKGKKQLREKKMNFKLLARNRK